MALLAQESRPSTHMHVFCTLPQAIGHDVHDVCMCALPLTRPLPCALAPTRSVCVPVRACADGAGSAGPELQASVAADGLRRLEEAAGTAAIGGSSGGVAAAAATAVAAASVAAAAAAAVTGEGAKGAGGSGPSPPGNVLAAVSDLSRLVVEEEAPEPAINLSNRLNPNNVHFDKDLASR